MRFLPHVLAFLCINTSGAIAFDYQIQTRIQTGDVIANRTIRRIDLQSLQINNRQEIALFAGTWEAGQSLLVQSAHSSRIVVEPGRLLDDFVVPWFDHESFIFFLNDHGQVAYGRDEDHNYIALDDQLIMFDDRDEDGAPSGRWAVDDLVLRSPGGIHGLNNDGTVYFSARHRDPDTGWPVPGLFTQDTILEYDIRTDRVIAGSPITRIDTFYFNKRGDFLFRGRPSEELDSDRILFLNGEPVVRTGDVLDGQRVHPHVIADLNEAGTVLFNSFDDIFNRPEDGFSRAYFTQYGQAVPFQTTVDDLYLISGTAAVLADDRNVVSTHWYNEPGDPPPHKQEQLKHLLMFNDHILIKSGDVFDGVAVNEILGLDANDVGDIIFLGEFEDRSQRVIQLAVNGLPGDFRGDGVLDVHDVDALVRDIARQTHSINLDLTGDGQVTAEDLRTWVVDLKATWFGDANLDGQFNSRDLVFLYQADEYEDALAGNSTWSTGDFNGDAEFTSADLVAAFNDGGYERGRRIEAQSVPEPTTMLVSILVCLLTLRSRCIVDL